MTLDLDHFRAEYLRLLETEGLTEQTLQSYLERTPALLPLHYPCCNRVFSKLRLGSDHVVDFAHAFSSTVGLQWYLIELEHPRVQLFTKAGDPSARLTHGIRQLHDWDVWLRNDYASARNALPFRRLASTSSLIPPELLLVIGRRQDLRDADRERLQRLSEPRLTIMTFDRLAESIGLLACFHQLPLVTCRWARRRLHLLGSMLPTESAAHALVSGERASFDDDEWGRPGRSGHGKHTH